MIRCGCTRAASSRSTSSYLSSPPMQQNLIIDCSWAVVARPRWAAIGACTTQRDHRALFGIGEGDSRLVGPFGRFGKTVVWAKNAAQGSRPCTSFSLTHAYALHRHTTKLIDTTLCTWGSRHAHTKRPNRAYIRVDGARHTSHCNLARLHTHRPRAEDRRHRRRCPHPLFDDSRLQLASSTTRSLDVRNKDVEEDRAAAA